MAVEKPIIQTQLLNIQMDLNAPKSNWNEFSKFKYRSCEDILKAVKPLCQREGVTLKMTDEIVQIGDKYYVKATASITNTEGASEKADGFAREADSKSGMDAAQITGSSSSYARKYALNGLFAIDDEQDPDTRDNRTESKPKPQAQSNASTYGNTPPPPKREYANKTSPKATEKQRKLIYNLLDRKGIATENQTAYLKEKYDVDGPLNVKQASAIINDMMGIRNEAA